MKSPWKEVLVAFLIGALAGWFAASRISEDRRGWRPGKMLERFSAELSLTADQKEKVGAILESKRQQIAALRSELRPRFEEIRNSSRAEIRKVLEPAQQQRFDKLEAQWDALRQKKRSRWRG